jgi:hypothetical protein
MQVEIVTMQDNRQLVTCGRGQSLQVRYGSSIVI